jgi:hypothetical protein
MAASGSALKRANPSNTALGPGEAGKKVGLNEAREDLDLGLQNSVDPDPLPKSCSCPKHHTGAILGPVLNYAKFL